VDQDRDPPRRPAEAVGPVLVPRRQWARAVSARLTGRLLDSDGRPSRGVRLASAATVVAAFISAFLVTMSAATPDAQPWKGYDRVPQAATSEDSRPAGLRTVAPLPDLRPEPPPPAVEPVSDTAAPVPTTAPPATPTATPTAAPPEPAAAAPAPTPAPAPRHAPEREQPAPEPSFDSSGEFDSSG
jgi:hypothetical protein